MEPVLLCAGITTAHGLLPMCFRFRGADEPCPAVAGRAGLVRATRRHNTGNGAAYLRRWRTELPADSPADRCLRMDGFRGFMPLRAYADDWFFYTIECRDTFSNSH